MAGLGGAAAGIGGMAGFAGSAGAGLPPGAPGVPNVPPPPMGLPAGAGATAGTFGQSGFPIGVAGSAGAFAPVSQPAADTGCRVAAPGSQHADGLATALLAMCAAIGTLARRRR
jgi:hypothetical protein